MILRLECTLSVENRGKAMGRSARGFIAIGCQKSRAALEATNHLLLTTKSNNHMRKIEMARFHRLIKDGKQRGMATFQFCDPNVVVFISQANPEKLCHFLKQFEAILSGKSSVLSQIQPTDVMQRVCAQAISSTIAKMTINTRAQYGELKSFPSSLKKLVVTGIGFRAIDMRWFGLHHLQHLSLAGNRLGTDWKARHWHRFSAISKLKQLTMLDLSENALESFPDIFMDALPISLVHLNLRFNQLTKLSNRISRLTRIECLRLDGNLMEELPEDLYLLKKLRELTLSRMQRLQFLPASLFLSTEFYGHFNILDVSGCEKAPFITGTNPAPQQEKKDIPTLSELAAAAVLNNSNLIHPDSRLLRTEVADCLPLMVQRHMRQWLRRCGICHMLYAPSSSDNFDHFHRVQLLHFTNHIYGSSMAHVRLQLCPRCSNCHSH